MNYVKCVFIIISLALSNLKAADGPCNEVFEDYFKKRDEGDVTRNILEYVRMLGPRFEKHLLSLKNEGQIVDFGSGESYFLKMYLLTYDEANQIPAKPDTQSFEIKQKLMEKLYSIPKEKRANVTGITYNIHNKFPTEEKKAQILSGRYFEEIPEEEIPFFDIGTDLFGIGAYTRRPDLYFQKVFNRMKPDGVLYTNIYPIYSKIKTEKGVKNLYEWLAEIPGVNAEKAISGFYMQFSKKNGVQIKVPKLKFISEPDGEYPPRRFFVEEK